MYWAQLETTNYRFNAFNYDLESALETMRTTWEEHALQTGATWTWEDVAPDVTLTFTRVGDGWRDSDLVTSGDKPVRSKAIASTSKKSRKRD